MLFLIFIMKIKKEELSFLITQTSLRPLRLCVMKFQNNSFKYMILCLQFFTGL